MAAIEERIVPEYQVLNFVFFLEAIKKTEKDR
jgi:hypothetical protein